MRKYTAQLVAIGLLTGCLMSASASASPIGLMHKETYFQDFDQLHMSHRKDGSTVLSYSLDPTGWFIKPQCVVSALGDVTCTNEQFFVNHGNDNEGATYSFGDYGDSERALGLLRSDNFSAPSMGAVFANQTGGVVDSLAISFTGEQWRVGGSGLIDRLDFQYSVDGGETWIDENALDFSSLVTSPTGALDGNSNSKELSAVIPGLEIGKNELLYVRWSDFNVSPGADDGLAIDDFSITAFSSAVSTVPEPGSLALLGLGLAGLAGLRRRGFQL